jgi:hypothetical protein
MSQQTVMHRLVFYNCHKTESVSACNNRCKTREEEMEEKKENKNIRKILLKSAKITTIIASAKICAAYLEHKQFITATLKLCHPNCHHYAKKLA